MPGLLNPFKAMVTSESIASDWPWLEGISSSVDTASMLAHTAGGGRQADWPGVDAATSASAPVAWSGGSVGASLAGMPEGQQGRPGSKQGEGIKEVLHAQ